MDGDAPEPRSETGAAAKTVQMGECTDVGLLDDVLRFAVVAKDSTGKPIKPAIVRTHDRTDRRLVAVTGTPDQFGVGSAIGTDLRCLCVGHGDLAGPMSRHWMQQSRT